MESNKKTSWRNQQKEELREQFYKTALDLFKSDGFDDTTVLKITKQAGTAKGTFFNYFPTKESVLLEWYKRITFDAISMVKVQTYTSAHTGIMDLSIKLMAGVIKNQDLWNMKTSASIPKAEFLETEVKMDGEILVLCQSLVEKGKAEGEFKNDLDVNLFTETYLNLMTGIGVNWVVMKNSFDLNEKLKKQVGLLLSAAK